MLSHVLALTGVLLLRRDRPNWPRPIKLSGFWMFLAGLFAALNLLFIIFGVAFLKYTGYAFDPADTEFANPTAWVPRIIIVGLLALAVGVIGYVVRAAPARQAVPAGATRATSSRRRRRSTIGRAGSPRDGLTTSTSDRGDERDARPHGSLYLAGCRRSRSRCAASAARRTPSSSATTCSARAAASYDTRTLDQARLMGVRRSQAKMRLYITFGLLFIVGISFATFAVWGLQGRRDRAPRERDRLVPASSGRSCGGACSTAPASCRPGSSSRRKVAEPDP